MLLHDCVCCDQIKIIIFNVTSATWSTRTVQSSQPMTLIFSIVFGGCCSLLFRNILASHSRGGDLADNLLRHRSRIIDTA